MSHCCQAPSLMETTAGSKGTSAMSGDRFLGMQEIGIISLT